MTGESLLLKVADRPDLDTYIERGLRDFDARRVPAPFAETEPLRIYVVDARGFPRGGLLGDFGYGALFVRTLWLHDDVRGRGYGRQLLDRAEAEARKRNIHRVIISTTSFHDSEFYRRRGYDCAVAVNGIAAGGDWLVFTGVV